MCGPPRGAPRPLFPARLMHTGRGCKGTLIYLEVSKLPREVGHAQLLFGERRRELHLQVRVRGRAEVRRQRARGGVLAEGVELIERRGALGERGREEQMLVVGVACEAHGRVEVVVKRTGTHAVYDLYISFFFYARVPEKRKRDGGKLLFLKWSVVVLYLQMTGRL